MNDPTYHRAPAYVPEKTLGNNTHPTPSVVTDNGLVERRFFIDHGMIHDRVTGKHVSTEPIEFGEGQLDHSPVTETCELLNSLAASDRDVLVGRIGELAAALKPFADCVDQIADDEDDEEWAKFRLLIKDYRRARAALIPLEEGL